MCVFERQTHWLDSHLTPIAARFDPTNPSSVELHANPMRSGSEGWTRFAPADRVQAVVDALHLLSNRQLRVKVFAAVIEKSQVANNKDIIPLAFEAIAIQFDGYLASLYQNTQNAQRGLVIFDRADFENHVQLLSHQFKHTGHTNGKLRNFAEVPLFIDSKASRLIQMADMIAYWIFRRYEAKDDRGFKMIEPYFHAYGGIKHGFFQNLSTVTAASFQNLPPHKHPFPAPSGLGVVLPQAMPKDD
ncbi:DUF3800 domain-containing protein [Patescibacteria group bacterium]|nr:MAG: DUF3800 domain-containing protein [Patescibacteria group bacterium]